MTPDAGEEGVVPEDIGLFEAMYTLRAMRRLKPDHVPAHLVKKVIEAATRAPSGGNRQPWNFIVIQDRRAKETIAGYYRRAWESTYGATPAVAREGMDAAARRNLRSAEHLAYHLSEVPVLILVCMRHAPPPGSPEIVRASQYGSIYPAVQNLMLAARGHGLGTALTTLHRAFEKEIKALLGVPEDVETVALIPLGWPEGRFGSGVRLPVEKVTYYDHWGVTEGGP